MSNGDETLLNEHNITLHGEQVVLRPMTENDWDILARWNRESDIQLRSCNSAKGAALVATFSVSERIKSSVHGALGLPFS